MKQSLELKLGQRLTMTPQLQHAIRLLQLSSAELLTEMHEALENNLLLERGDDDEFDNPLDGPADDDGRTTAESEDLREIELESDCNPSIETAPEFEDGDDLEWRDQGLDHRIGGNTRQNDTSFEIEDRNSQPITLRDHLSWQIHTVPFSARDRTIAEILIECIDEDGYLNASLDEIAEILRQIDTDASEIQAVLRHIQNCDPVGVGARDLSECLLIQLRQLEPGTSGLSTAKQIVQEHLDLLARRETTQLCRRLGIDEKCLQEAIFLIKSLNPKPGGAIDPNPPDYVIPDVLVSKRKGRWRADLNSHAFPQIRLNRHYQTLLQTTHKADDSKFLQEHLQQARWFLRSLKNRNDTLFDVARAIVERQQAFFDQGEEAMKPLILHDIAIALNLHESTISRATTRKYMLTPRGMYELKQFFSSHVSTSDGGTFSATAIRSLIKKIVDSESPTKPISDNQIAGVLRQQGIQVARRTVAKYRETMNIPPSSRRKSIV